MFTCQLSKNLVTKSGRLVTVNRQNISKSGQVRSGHMIEKNYKLTLKSSIQNEWTLGETPPLG
jgi:hypothetical protein